MMTEIDTAAAAAAATTGDTDDEDICEETVHRHAHSVWTVTLLSRHSGCLACAANLCGRRHPVNYGNHLQGRL
jgi:hypothetical protein